jgi:hypothetical protein
VSRWFVPFWFSDQNIVPISRLLIHAASPLSPHPRSRNQREQVAADCWRWFLARDFSTLKMEAIRYSETSGNTRSTWRHIPEDGILHSHRRENLRSYRINIFGKKLDIPGVELVTPTQYSKGLATLDKQTGWSGCVRQMHVHWPI